MDAADWDARGRELTDRGDLEGAEAAFRAALELDPGSPDLLYNLGTVLRDRGLRGEARSALLAALEAAPPRADALTALGLLAWEEGDGI